MRLDNIIVGLLIVIIMGLSAACSVRRYNECRRYHPWWYCVEGR